MEPSTLPRLDPRLYQAAVLASLLVYGLTALAFEIALPQVIVTITVALATQWLGSKLTRLPSFDPKSALISALSLCLLLRTHHLAVAALASIIAVGSKFVVRWRGKHVFNPTNLALVALLPTGLAWVSPGQWGNIAFFAFLMACLGGWVVNRAARSDVTLAFLVCYAGILVSYSHWLGQPPAVPIHRVQNGAFLLFSFFMISDPKTTPDSRAGRLLFGVLVAIGAAFVPLALYRNNGLLWALAALSPLVPLIDRLLPGTRYAWTRPTTGPGPSPGGVHDEVAPQHAAPVPVPARVALAPSRP
jgi:Na+-transporting NADH:ubiquinone oxidoreductase subunit NqrB